MIKACEGLSRFDLEAYGTGSMKTFSFGKQLGPAWWAHAARKRPEIDAKMQDFVANWMDLCYQNMSEQYVYPRRDSMQRRVLEETENAIESSAPCL